MARILYVDATHRIYNKKKLSIVYVFNNNRELLYREKLEHGHSPDYAEMYAIKCALNLYPDEKKIIRSDCEVSVNALNTQAVNILMKIEAGLTEFYECAKLTRIEYEESESIVEWVSRNKNVAGKYIEKLNRLRNKFS